MAAVRVEFPDGDVKEFEQGTSFAGIAGSISQGLAKKALVARFDGKLMDMRAAVEKDGKVEFLTFDSKEGKDVLRHSTSHLMAQAVEHLYPGTKLAIGPAIENGFYYDFDTAESFTPEDLAKIEEEMARLVKEDLPFERQEVSRDEALDLFRKRGEIYKVELIEDLPVDATISMYQQGDFIDLCAGPHVPSTGKLKAFKLLSVAGAYWRGSEKNKMLQRIYGTSFSKQDELKEYLNRLEEAKKRDHRKIGQELDLFSIQEEGPGFPFFHPKGMILRNELESFWREEHLKRGYQEVKTPVILNQRLWEQSGHWENYQENMYFTKIDENDYAIKPMNCPGGILIYRQKVHSYRDLPVRMGELGLVHRHEKSGVLHGLMRVRCFTQDDAHIFMLPSQIKDEIINVIDLIDYFYGVFGFKYHVELSTKPEKAMGSDEIWEKATDALREALDAKGMPYIVNEGDGAFYGPKIDFHLEDCIGRTWQCGTIQLDFLMPEKFDLSYIGEDGQKHRPVMIHRVVFGSIERFIGILIEHFAGALPTWLSPVQVRVLPITDRSLEYARTLEEQLRAVGIRGEIDGRNEKIGYKIREAQREKIPYMLVVGDKEVEQELVAVRRRTEGDIGAMPMTEFLDMIVDEIRTKKNYLQCPRNEEK